MHIEWNKVTWYSKLIAVIVFAATAWVFFDLGSLYGQATGAINMVTPSATSTSPSTASTTAPTSPAASQPQGGSPSAAAPSGAAPAPVPAGTAITFIAPTTGTVWTLQNQNVIQWSRASGSAGSIILLNASTGATVGWIQQQILGTQNSFAWDTRDVFVSKTSPQQMNIAPGNYRIAITFIATHDPEIVSPTFTVTVPASTITIKGAVFAPSATTVTQGAVLTFVNDDAVGYTVAITSKGTFTIPPSTSQTFNTGILSAGTYTFYSTASPTLSMTVTVKQGS